MVLLAVCGTALALAVSTVVTAPSASAEDAPPVIASVDARPEVVGLYGSGSTPVTVDVHVTDDIGVVTVDVLLVAEPRVGDDDVPPDRARAAAALVSGTTQDGVWRASFSLDRRDVPGAWSTEVGVRDSSGNGAFAGHVYDEHYSVPPVDDFVVKRNTVISDFNVAEPVARGAYVRLQGRLLRMSPTSGRVGYAGQAVQVCFRAAGSTTWTVRGTLTTGSTGWFASSRTFRAHRDGVWRAQFKGTATHLPETSRGDYVDTR